MIFGTNIFIYADRGVLSAKQLIETAPEKAISAVTYLEYVPFCRNKKEVQIFEKLLETYKFAIYDIDAAMSSQARQMVKDFALSHRIEMADALIAATALAHDEMLCTSNVKHFLPISRIKLEIYSPL